MTFADSAAEVEKAEKEDAPSCSWCGEEVADSFVRDGAGVWCAEKCHHDEIVAAEERADMERHARKIRDTERAETEREDAHEAWLELLREGSR